MKQALKVAICASLIIPSLAHAKPHHTKAIVPAIETNNVEPNEAKKVELTRDAPTKLDGAPTSTKPNSITVQEPDVAPKYPPPPLNLMSTKNPKLNSNEQQALGISTKWANSRSPASNGKDGLVIFNYGASLPSIVCAPLMVCDLALEAGEVVNDIHIGDAVRWRISPATSGSGNDLTTHVIIKPTDAALATNLLITTDRRTYVLKLISRQKDWMARVAFSYPEDSDKEWQNYFAQHSLPVKLERENETTHALDFNYKIIGDNPKWKPVRAYIQGDKTIIEFPKNFGSSEAPALVALSTNNQTQLVNYRVQDNLFVVDKIIDKAALSSGVGKNQTKVEIIKIRGNS